MGTRIFLSLCLLQVADCLNFGAAQVLCGEITLIKALYVDDDEDISTIVEMCLDLDGGFETRCVGSGKLALAEAESWQPDVVLLDYMMPVMDGPTTFGHLQEKEVTKDIPVIFITAKSMREDVDMLNDLGVAGVISKPFDPVSLADEIRACLTPQAPVA